MTLLPGWKHASFKCRGASIIAAKNYLQMSIEADHQWAFKNRLEVPGHSRLPRPSPASIRAANY